jgi:hypothetical protein
LFTGGCLTWLLDLYEQFTQTGLKKEDCVVEVSKFLNDSALSAEKFVSERVP